VSNDVVILMMVYNHEKLVGESLEALLAQTVQNFDLLIVDDVSKDKSVEVVASYQKKFRSCRIICNEKNKGSVGNFHYCTTLIEKDYPDARFFLWCAPDDTWSLDYIEKTRAALIADPMASVCQSGYEMIYLKDGRSTSHVLKPLETTNYRTARNVFYSHGSKDAKTHYNNVIHGMVRFSEFRKIFPPDRELLMAMLCTEISVVIAMLLRGRIITVDGILYHKKKLGRFVDLHKNDELTINTQKPLYLAGAVIRSLPRLLKINRAAGTSTVLLLWCHLFYYYVVLNVAHRARRACRNLLRALKYRIKPNSELQNDI
jgi:glycosyltransferase involved in cell wall biosynthesis